MLYKCLTVRNTCISSRTLELKKILYVVFVNNRIIKFLSHSALGIVIPPIVGLYYGTLDIWGDEWLWIKEKKDLHELIFTILASFTVLI